MSERGREFVIRAMTARGAPDVEFRWTFSVGLAVLGVLWFYQYHWRARSFEEYIAVTTMLLLGVTLLAVIGPMRSSPESFGLSTGDGRLGARYAVGMLAAMVPFLWLSSHTRSALEYYPLFRRFPAAYPISWHYVAYFELLYGFYLFAWEWFFRGFLLFGLARGLGSWALFAQAVPFCLLHWGKPVPELIGSFFAGIVLGFVAFRSGSFLAGFLTHWVVSVLYDLLVLAALGAAGTGLF